MKPRSLIVILGATALAIAATASLAIARGPHGGHGRGEPGARMAEKLGLDDKQKATLKDLRDDMRDDVQSLHEQIRAKHDAMRALFTAPSPDRAKIVAAMNEINALKGQVALRHLDFVFAAKPVLTAEQFRKFVDLVGQRGGRGMGGGRGHHGGGFGPPDGGPGFGPRDGGGPGGPGCPMADGPDGDDGDDSDAP